MHCFDESTLSLSNKSLTTSNTPHFPERADKEYRRRSKKRSSRRALASIIHHRTRTHKTTYKHLLASLRALQIHTPDK